MSYLSWSWYVANFLLSVTCLTSCSDRAVDPSAQSSRVPVDIREAARPPVDQVALDAANSALSQMTSSDSPLMRAPERGGAGVTGTVSLSGEKPGSPRAAAQVEPRRPIEAEFTDASLRTIIEFVFREMVQKPYTILSDFQDKKVSWRVIGEYSKDETMRMVENFLDANGVKIALRDNLYVISSQNQRSGPVSASQFGQMTVSWRLSHTNAAELVPILKQFMSQPDRIQVLGGANVIVATGTQTEIGDLERFIRSTDIAVFSNRSIIIYEPRAVSPQALVALLQRLPQNLSAGGQQGASVRVDADPVQGKNMVVIVTETGQLRTAVLDYLSKIDKPEANARGVFYYQLRNAQSDKIVSVVNQTLTDLFPGDGRPQVIEYRDGNSLIVNSTPEQYFEIRRVLNRLDFIVPSVVIDATIVEVALNHNLDYGVEWYLHNAGKSILGDITGNLTNSNIGTTAAATINLVHLSKSWYFILDLLKQVTTLKVLSRPRIVVRNGANAKIQSVDEIRVLDNELAGNSTSSSSVSDLSIRRAFKDKSVGLTLDVTPSVSDDGTVNVKLKIEDSRQGPLDTNSPPQPTFTKRSVDTTVTLANGETILIGGLFREKSTGSKTGIPPFTDIPYLGAFFSNESEAEERTELIVLMTPLIILDRAAARIITESLTAGRQITRSNPSSSKPGSLP